MMPAPTPIRRLFFLSALAVLVGLAGGGAAYVLYHLIALLTNVVLFHRWGWTRIPSFTDFHPGPVLLLEAAAGGLTVSLLAMWSPIIRGHGIPEAMEAVLTKQSRISPRSAVAKPLSAAIAIGTGGPFGAEGPIIVTGGALGSLLGQVIKVSPAERKILLASGAAAGMAATFGTPLAAVLLAIELLLFEFSTRAFVPLVVASALAAGIHTHLFGSGPLFAVPPHDFTGLGKLPLFVVLGVTCGLLATVVTRGLFVIEGMYRRLPVREFWHPIIGALIFASIGLAVPRALGVGYPAISDVLLGRLAAGALSALLLAKLGAWWFALASGTSGGTLAPILLIGGSFGSLFGILADQVAPGLHISPGAFALVAMAATFGAATRATFTAIVFLFELTRDYQVILPLMLASVVADLIAAALLPETLMTDKLVRRGLHVHAEYEVDVLRTTRIRDIMTSGVESLPADAMLSDARERFKTRPHAAYPLVDEDGRCVAMLSRTDLLLESPDGDRPVLEVASGDVVDVSPDQPAITALQRMLEEDVDHLPVVERHRLVGICTRTDILRARQRQFEHESPEPGWRPQARWRLRPVRSPASLETSGRAEPVDEGPEGEPSPGEG
jgi:CIC family chloride channel protein